MPNPIIRRSVIASFLFCWAFAANAERYTIPLLVPPGATGDPQGAVRILNDAQESATVTIHAIDDAAVRSGPATLLLDALAAVDLSAGVGNWRLSVTSDQPILAVTVAVAPGTGRWSNLATTAASGWAPEGAAAFEARFLQRAIVFRDGRERTEWHVLAGNRLSVAEMEDGMESVVEAAFRYDRIGRDAGRLSFQPDGGAHCEMRVFRP